MSWIAVESRCGILRLSLRLLERGHHVLGEPAELVLELRGREAFGPVDHEGLEARILVGDRPDAVDHVARRAAEPRLLRDAVAQRRHPCRRAGRAPGAAVLVSVADEAERREPLVALVVRRLDPANGFLLAVGEVEAGAPDHVLAELLRPAMAL